MPTEPKITSVNLTPNPVSINAAFKVAVAVIEVEIVMYRASPISGAFKSGQSIILTKHIEEVD